MNRFREQVKVLLRSFAYDMVCRRDRLSGWKAGREEFRACTKKDPRHLREDAEGKLRTMLVHAYETSPYYRAAWKQAGLHPSARLTLDEFEQYPFLDKDIIRQHKSSLVSERFQTGGLDLDYTGGTTGTHTSFFRDHACTVSRVGRQWGILEQCGYRPGMRRALVWGVHTDLPDGSMRRGLKQRFREYAGGQETLCCTVMSESAMSDYHARLRRFSPEVMYGYPNALIQLGRFIQQRNLAPIRVGRVITTAERLTDSQRELLRELFGGEVFNLYCTREYGCVGFECDKHDGFHIDAESVFVEIVKDGRRVKPGESGEITITDLLNYGMPLIRSRTGDLGMLSTKPCGCGSPLPVLKGLDGRVTDIVYKRDGSVVSGVMLVDLFMDMPSIEAAQFVQDVAGGLDVNLVVTGEFSDSLEQVAHRQIRDLVGSEMTIKIRRVPEIARNPRSGKFQEVICRIKDCDTANAGGRESQ